MPVVPQAAGLGRDGVEMIGQRRPGEGGEEAVAEREPVGIGPVVGQVGAVVVAHRVRGAPGLNEAVHPPAVHRRVGHLPGVAHIVGEVEGEVKGPHFRRPAGEERHPQAGRKALGAGVGAEVVVEGVVLLNQEDDVLDAPPRLRPDRGRRPGLPADPLHLPDLEQPPPHPPPHADHHPRLKRRRPRARQQERAESAVGARLDRHQPAGDIEYRAGDRRQAGGGAGEDERGGGQQSDTGQQETPAHSHRVLSPRDSGAAYPGGRWASRARERGRGRRRPNGPAGTPFPAEKRAGCLPYGFPGNA